MAASVLHRQLSAPGLCPGNSFGELDPEQSVHDHLFQLDLHNEASGTSDAHTSHSLSGVDAGFYDASQDVAQVLELLQDTSDDILQHHGLQYVEAWLDADDTQCLQSFLDMEGAEICVELMGPFSTSEVQHDAAHVATRLCLSGQQFCQALLCAGAPSVLMAHIRSPNSTLKLFEAAADATAAFIDSSYQVTASFEKAGIMSHLLAALGDDTDEAGASRRAAMRGIAALCRASPRSQSEFLHLGGVSTILQTLLQNERGSLDHLAAVRLVADGLAHTDECRALIGDIGGIDLLVQVFRDSYRKSDRELHNASLWALARLTYAHSDNQTGLERASRMLSCEVVCDQVTALHQSSKPIFASQNSLQTYGSLNSVLSDGRVSDVGSGTRLSDAPAGSMLISGDLSPAHRRSTDFSLPKVYKSLTSSTKKMLSSLKRLGSSGKRRESDFGKLDLSPDKCMFDSDVDLRRY